MQTRFVRTVFAALCILHLIPIGVFAQEPAAGSGRSPAEKAMEVLNAIDLPARAAEAREQGVAEEKIRDVLSRGRAEKISPGTLAEGLEAENEAIRAGESADNFGSFVRQQVDSGLRGRELAAAIREEKARRGIGGGRGRGPDRGEPGSRPGRPEHAMRERSEEARQRAEEARGGAESARQAAEDARKRAEGAREGAAPDSRGGPPEGKGTGKAKKTAEDTDS